MHLLLFHMQSSTHFFKKLPNDYAKIMGLQIAFKTWLFRAFKSGVPGVTM